MSSRLITLGGWLLAFAALMGARALAESPAAIESPAELWAGYDPRALPLEVESIKAWNEGATHFEKLRFTGEEAGGGKVRVFAITGNPTSGAAEVGLRPGVLHIHGGGQTASLDWVRFWTERGYVCVTYDFCGAWENRQEFTDWGPLKHGNMAHAAGGYQVTPTPRESSWYHWTLLARRALTLLEQQPGVDRDRLGIFGISVGGTLCWSVAGSDSRVKAAVPIYGCGYNLDGTREPWGFGKLTPEQALFQRAVSPEAHAPYITCPTLHLNATNDFHGWFNRSYDILSATAGPHILAVTPWQNHHIAAEQGANLPLWMDAQLNGGAAFPVSPTLAVQINSEGIPQAVARGEEKVLAADVYYSLGDKPAPNRFWRKATASSADRPFAAEMPIIDPWQELWAFANVRFASGACLSSNLVRCVPGMLGKARGTLVAGQPIADRIVAESWCYARGYTDPNLSAQFVTIEGREGRPSILQQNPAVFGDPITIDLFTHAVGDPQFAPPPGARLALDVAGQVDDAGLQVILTEHDWTPLSRTHVATIKREELTGEWATLELPLERFVPQHNQPAATDWSNFDKLNLRGSSPKAQPIRISHLRWLPAK